MLTPVAKLVGFIVVATLYLAQPVLAYQLDAEAPPEERRLLNVPYSNLRWMERQVAQYGVPLVFSDPIHEELTTRMFGCDGDSSICGGANSIAADPAILVGVRWNDDPPFRLNAEARGKICKAETIRFQTQPSCWLKLFKSAEGKSAAGRVYGPGDGMLFRTHFGDLQFLHGMASGEGVPAITTQRKMLAWAEFTWRVAIKEWPKDMFVRDIPIADLKDHFGTAGWDLRDLFILGSPLLERRIHQVAFGSLLHMLQDSFAEGHAQRSQPPRSERCVLGQDNIKAPGRIVEFHSYIKQDHDVHAEFDSKEAKDRHLLMTPDVVDLGKPLVEALENQTPWNEVRPYVECLFALAEPNQPSSAGESFMTKN